MAHGRLGAELAHAGAHEVCEAVGIPRRIGGPVGEHHLDPQPGPRVLRDLGGEAGRRRSGIGAGPEVVVEMHDERPATTQLAERGQPAGGVLCARDAGRADGAHTAAGVDPEDERRGGRAGRRHLAHDLGGRRGRGGGETAAERERTGERAGGTDVDGRGTHHPAHRPRGDGRPAAPDGCRRPDDVLLDRSR
ncbi:MAG: hypothetical protein MUC84_08815 [Solirubrobacteraceae bacterium]|nr:hypothetical protein [Solirubrobacteraceae bacterium]